eukprot:Awhi_evm1s11746
MIRDVSLDENDRGTTDEVFVGLIEEEEEDLAVEVGVIEDDLLLVDCMEEVLDEIIDEELIILEETVEDGISLLEK